MWWYQKIVQLASGENLPHGRIPEEEKEKKEYNIQTLITLETCLMAEYLKKKKKEYNIQTLITLEC